MEKPKCSICFDKIESDLAFINCDCRATYHTHCLHTWLDQNASCPICRKNVKIFDHKLSNTSIKNINGKNIYVFYYRDTKSFEAALLTCSAFTLGATTACLCNIL